MEILTLCPFGEVINASADLGRHRQVAFVLVPCVVLPTVENEFTLLLLFYNRQKNHAAKSPNFKCAQI